MKEEVAIEGAELSHFEASGRAVDMTKFSDQRMRPVASGTQVCQRRNGLSGSKKPFVTVRFGTGKGYRVSLAVEADDEHWPRVAIALWLAGGQDRREIALRRHIADAFAETARAEFFGAAEEVDRALRIVGGEHRFHCAEMLVAEREDVRPHCERV